MKKSSAIKLILKLTVGGLLIYYVMHSRMVDFQKLKEVIFSPLNLLIGLLFCGFSALCCSVRWFLLVRAQGLTLSFKNIFELTMIGAFFNTFMPGSVGGDLIKAWYITGHEPNRKTKAIFTVLLDRLMGLSVIIFYSAVTLLFYTQWMHQRKELEVLAYSIWIFTAAGFFLTLLFFTPGLWNFRVVSQSIEILHRFKPISKVIDAGLLYRNHFSAILLALILSICSIMGINLLYSIVGSEIGITLPLSHYFFIVPMGLMASAIPLLPGGVGVGQVAFFTLFSWLNEPNPSQGGALATVLQVYMILFNCMGAFFYLKYKRKPQVNPDFESEAIPKQVQTAL